MMNNKAILKSELSSNICGTVVRNRIEKKLTIPTTRKLFTPSTSVTSLSTPINDFQSSQQGSYKVKLKDSVSNMLALNVITPPGPQKVLYFAGEHETSQDDGIYNDASITDSASVSVYSVEDMFSDMEIFTDEYQGVVSTRNDIIPSRDRIEKKYSQETLIDSHRRLLAEMGTIRNYRSKVNKDVPYRFDSMKLLSQRQVSASRESAGEIATRISDNKVKTIRFSRKFEDNDNAENAENAEKTYPKGPKLLVPNLSTDITFALSDKSVMFGKFNCIAIGRIPALFKDININNSSIAIHNIATTKLRLNSAFKLKRGRVKAVEVRFPSV